MKAGAIKEVAAHQFERQAEEHYVENQWCSDRLFDEEPFVGPICDPACGFGRIPEAARRHGIQAHASDIVDRGYEFSELPEDFLASSGRYPNFVTNPPFGPRRAPMFKRFALHALALADHKVAMIWMCRCLPAARWLQRTPLATIYYLTPRPSMPPGHIIAAGGKASGGKQDFCWLVWDKKMVVRPPETKWLHRDRGAI